jgi:ATP-dependent Clp protease ATP-binding subunit ClpC
MFERFTDRARQVVVDAQVSARRLGHGYVGTEHILLGLVREGEGLAMLVLVRLGAGPDAIRARVLDALRSTG